MEMLDVYDNKKNKVNKKVKRYNEELNDGEYVLSVHVWILNSKGEFLIQKRAHTCTKNPDKWAFTGGAVTASETSIHGAIREVKEELGIKILDNELELMLSFKEKKRFKDIWLVRKDINIEDLHLQVEEVSDAKLVLPQEINKLIENEDFVKSTKLYYDLFLTLLNKK